MSQNDLIVDVLRRNLAMLQSTVADMTDADLIQRPVPGANNGLWQLGHLINSESRLVNGGAGKTVIELPAGFADRYNTKTASIDDPAQLGNKADLLALLGEAREKTCHWAASLTAADMARPAPEPMQKRLPTVGHIVNLIPTHVSMHIGQLQVLRRKLGKPILF
ncbi:MAG: DinB family protein [Tepidisphaeraceae bacterium]|jgi:hypothetical protein